jgi:cell division protein FtsQ
MDRERPRLSAPKTAVRRRPAERAPTRPSRFKLWLRRKRGLLRPAGLGLLVLGALGIGAAGIIAFDPYGRATAFWEGASDLAGDFGLQVREVTLDGARNTPPELIREALGIRRGDPLLGFDPHAARERLELIAWVKEAHVQRHLNGSIRIRLVEREPFAIWRRGGRFVVIDRAGNIVTEENIGAFGRLPLVVGPGAAEIAAPMVDLVQARPELRDRTQALVRVAERRWNLLLRNNTEVLLPEGQEAAALARLMELQKTQSLLDRPLAAIDLRLPDRLVLRLPAQPAAAPAGEPPSPLQRVRNTRG